MVPCEKKLEKKFYAKSPFPFLCCQTLMDVCSLLPRTHLPTLVVSVVSMVILIVTKELNSFLNRKLPVPIPTELITVSIKHITEYSVMSRNLCLLLLMLQKGGGQGGISRVSGIAAFLQITANLRFTAND